MTSRQHAAASYRAYLEARYDAAEEETAGHMLTARGEALGLSARRNWFSGRMASLRYASEELIDWFAVHGPTLTATEFHAQSIGVAHSATKPDPDDTDSQVTPLVERPALRAGRCSLRHGVPGRPEYRRVRFCSRRVPCMVRVDGSTVLPRAG